MQFGNQVLLLLMIIDVHPGVASVSGGSVATQVEFNVTDILESVLGLDVLISLLLTAPGTVDRLSTNPFSIATKQSLAW